MRVNNNNKISETLCIGAIIGDMIGRPYEFDNIKTKDFELFTDASKFTDDTVLTIAIMDYLTNAENTSQKTVAKYLKKWGQQYHYAGYGGRFNEWLWSKDSKPYNSYGNGSAMRISAVGWLANDEKELREMVDNVTEVTHNHPEGIKGAYTVAKCIMLARQSFNKEDIKIAASSTYPELRTMDYQTLVDTYEFDETCQGSVPQAIYCFLISNSFEDCIRTAVSIGGDTDTICAMAGSIAEAYYGIPEDIANEALSRLPAVMKKVVEEFNWSLNMK